MKQYQERSKPRNGVSEFSNKLTNKTSDTGIVIIGENNIAIQKQNINSAGQSKNKLKSKRIEKIGVSIRPQTSHLISTNNDGSLNQYSSKNAMNRETIDRNFALAGSKMGVFNLQQVHINTASKAQNQAILNDQTFDVQFAGRQTAKRSSINSAHQKNYFYQKSASLATAQLPYKGQGQTQTHFFYQPLIKSSQSYLQQFQNKDQNQGIISQYNYQQALKSQELNNKTSKSILQNQIYSQVDLLTAGTSVNDLNLMKITQNGDSNDYIKYNQKLNDKNFNRQNYSGSILKHTQPNSSKSYQQYQQEYKRADGVDISKNLHQQSSQNLIDKNIQQSYNYGIVPTGAKLLHHISGRQALEQYRASDFSQIITSARDFVNNDNLQRNQLNEGSVMSSNHYQVFQHSQRQAVNSYQRIPETKTTIAQYQTKTIHERGIQKGRKYRPTTAKPANYINKNVDIQMQGISRGHQVQTAIAGGSTQASANQSQTFHHITTNDSHKAANTQTRFQSPNPYLIRSRVTTTKATGDGTKTNFMKNQNRESLSGFSSQSGVEQMALDSASNKNYMNIKGSKNILIRGFTQGKEQILETDEHESARNNRLQYDNKNKSIARTKSRKAMRRSGMNNQNHQIDRFQSNSQKSDCSIKSKKDQTNFTRTFKQKKQSQGQQSIKNIKNFGDDTQDVLKNLILNPSSISSNNAVGLGERNRILLLRQRTSQAASTVHFQNKHETKQTRQSSSQMSIDVASKQMQVPSPSKGKNSLPDDQKRVNNLQYPYNQVFHQKSNTKVIKSSQSPSPIREIYESGNIRRTQSISINEGVKDTIDQRFNLKQVSKGLEQNSQMLFQATDNGSDEDENQRIDKIQESGRMSILMKELNSQLNKSLAFLDHFQTQRDPMMNKEAIRISKFDCQAVLNKAQKQIKIIQYKCNTTVAAENERILVIQPPGQNEGNLKGPERQLDIIEKCPLICKIDVKGRKAPLKFYINYDTNVNKNKTKNNPLSPRASISPEKGNVMQIDNNRPKTAYQKQKLKRASVISSEIGYQSTNGNQISNLISDLTIFVSEDKKNPDQFNSFQQIKNPGAKFTIRLSENNTINTEDKKNNVNVLSKLKANNQEKDCFKCKSLYLSFNSEKGCSIIVSCSFPSQGQKQGTAGGIYGDEDQKQIFMTAKDIKKKIQNKVDKDVGDLLGDESGQNQYFEHIQMLKNKRAAAGLKNADINFLEQNIDNLREKEQIERKKKELRDKNRERLEEARLIREKIFEDKQKKAQFEMLKWELFRQKCDQIDERWANFKKRQLKLLWWNQIISTFFCAQRTRLSFEQYKTKKIGDIKRKLKAFRIQFCFRKFLLRQGKNDLQRNKNYIRKCFSFGSNFKFDTAVQISIMHLKKFFGDKIEQNTIMGRFRSFHENCQFIQRNIKYEIKNVRESRIQSLNQFWDRERDRLLIYYREKSKKNKKLKTIYNSLVKITVNTKYKILIENYYEQKVFYQNLQAAILLQAQIEVRRGPPKKMVHKTRIYPMTIDQKPFYTDQEYKNLVDIERQLIAVNSFLFKGTKEIKCIGEKEGHELYDLDRKIVKVKKVIAETIVAVKKAEPINKKKKMHEEVDDEEKKDDGDMENESKEDQNSMGGDKDSEKDEMDSPRASKSPEQRANDVIEQGGNETKKGKGKSGKESVSIASASLSQAKKGGSKKKKKKEVEIKLPRDFDMNVQDGRKQCLPTRAVMQKMIMRAAQLKKNEEGPHFLEIRPWVVKLRKELNADILLD